MQGLNRLMKQELANKTLMLSVIAAFADGNLEPLFAALREPVPAPSYDPTEPLRAHVTNLDASAYRGRIALCRGESGEIEGDAAQERAFIGIGREIEAVGAKLCEEKGVDGCAHAGVFERRDRRFHDRFEGPELAIFHRFLHGIQHHLVFVDEELLGARENRSIQIDVIAGEGAAVGPEIMGRRLGLRREEVSVLHFQTRRARLTGQHAVPRGPQLRSRAMGLILTATAGLCLWIILWAINISGFDAILIAIVMVVIAIGVRTLLPFLPGRRG